MTSSSMVGGEVDLRAGVGEMQKERLGSAKRAKECKKICREPGSNQRPYAATDVALNLSFRLEEDRN